MAEGEQGGQRGGLYEQAMPESKAMQERVVHICGHLVDSLGIIDGRRENLTDRGVEQG